jgi:alpha-glucosidase (family GH31 glycosyl hydrolase)
VGTTDITGLNPTHWLNHYRFMNNSQPSSRIRAHIHSRFGGLGGHRYVTQFGGDVTQSWDSTAAMIYTNAIAANVLVGYWAMEIMQSGSQHELYARVIQMGAWSPVFTIWGNDQQPCNLWDDGDFPQPYRAAAQLVLAQRAMTIPYR